MSMQVTKVWWDGDKLMAEPISESEVYKPEPVTEWLTCPKCSHKSPYTPIKAKTLAEDAERITKQARAALAQMQPAQQQEPVAYITPLMEQQMFDDWCPYKGNPDPRTVWAAAIEAVNGLLLGASPPASKPWVGLTDAEIRDWWRIENGLEDCDMAKLVDFTLAVRAIEAKLREKNS